MKKNIVRRKHDRSWAVTVIAGIIAAVSLYIGAATFALNIFSVVVSAAFFLFAVYAAMISIAGKRRTLGELLDSMLTLP